MTEWISVKERLPESDVPVLVCEDGEVTTIAIYGPRPWLNLFVNEWRVKENCTGYECEEDSCEPEFWMPLPEPPVKEP